MISCVSPSFLKQSHIAFFPRQSVDSIFFDVGGRELLCSLQVYVTCKVLCSYIHICVSDGSFASTDFMLSHV